MPERILVVDDERPLRELTRRILSRDGYAVITAGSADEAIAACRTSGPLDLVLSDVVMPDLDGESLAARLREIQPGLSVLYMSGYAGPSLAVEEQGQIISKPFSAATLTRSVARVLGRRAQERRFR